MNTDCLTAPAGVVKVIHGANDGEFDGLVGATVQQVYRYLIDAFNLSNDSIALINGVRVEPDCRLESNDTLEFCKRAGRKAINRLFAMEQIEKEYGLTAELCNQIAAGVTPLGMNGGGQALYSESAIDGWIECRSTGIDKTQLLQNVAVDLRRIADRLDPPSPDKVGTPYVADRLGCTTVWITELIRKGEISSSCIVPGTGNGKPWKFFRDRIDRWLKGR